MAHDVFISYSSHDKTTADAICARLEARNTRCWIAPRDIRPGSDWAESIIDAIASGKVMVVVVSEETNGSRQVLREVERAVKEGLIIIPFRIQDVPLSKSLAYFLGTCHWLDALTPPLEAHINRVTEIVTALVMEGQNARREDSSAPSRSERERAIDKLTGMLVAKRGVDVDWPHLAQAIEAMAVEPELKLHAGRELIHRLPPENPDVELDLAVKLLVDSGLKEAIAPLTSLLEYDASWDHTTCCAGMAHSVARTTLRNLVANHPQFLYEAARTALEILARQKDEGSRDLVKTWARELLRELAASTDSQRDWAREQLEELNVSVP